MRQPADELARLRTVARRLIWGAVVCVALPILAWLGATLYERLASPSAGHQPDPLITGLVLYLVPVGLVLLLLGLLASLFARWLGRRRARESPNGSRPAVRGGRTG